MSDLHTEPEPAAKLCDLCRTPVPADRDGGFCCAGCAHVYEVLANLDPETHTEYLQSARRLGVIPDGPGTPPTTTNHALPDDPRAQRDQRFDIDGLVCPACAWVVEQVLTTTLGVRWASVDFFTGAARVQFDLRQTSAQQLDVHMAPLGYRLAEIHEVATADRSRGLTFAFIVSAILFANLMSLSVLRYFEGLGALDEVPDFLSWLELALCVPVLWLGWLPALRRSIIGLRRGHATMDLLISLAVLAAFALSLAALLQGRDDIYFETSAGLVTIMLLSRMIEARLRSRAASDLNALLRLRARRVRCVDDGRERYVDTDAIEAGALCRFLPGEPVPLDGVVEQGAVDDGAAQISEAVLTGEPRAIAKRPGDAVVAGSTLVDGELLLRVSRRASETMLHRIADEVTAGLARAESALRSADRIAARFVPVVLLIALGVWLARWLLYGATYALSADGWFPSVAVLAVACPCAFSLAGVAALTAATGALLRRGWLVKEPAQLENLYRVQSVIFDKTGTLTNGVMQVERLVWRAQPRPELLAAVLAMEHGQSHPVADAIRVFLRAKNVHDHNVIVKDIIALSGRGLSATHAEQSLTVGAQTLFEDTFDANLDARHSAVWLGVDGVAEACLVLRDSLRPDAASTVAALAKLGLRQELLSGDRDDVTARVAQELGIDRARGDVRLEDKVSRVHELVARGEAVAYVGDGTNDALAMAEATVSIALPRSSDEALSASGLVLLQPHLQRVVQLFTTGRKLRRVVRGNYLWAFGFNALFIPVAATGGLRPLAAMLLMLVSSTAVLLNSLRLRGTGK